MCLPKLRKKIKMKEKQQKIVSRGWAVWQSVLILVKYTFFKCVIMNLKILKLQILIL